MRSGKWRIWTPFFYAHNSFGGTNSQRVKTCMTLNSLLKVLISTNISSIFKFSLVLISIQTVLDCFYILTVCFIKILSHFPEIPQIMIHYYMNLQGHRKGHIFMKVPEVDFKVKDSLFTSGVTVLFGDNSKMEFLDTSEVIQKGLSLNWKHVRQLFKI